jgi:hypothetical protein
LICLAVSILSSTLLSSSYKTSTKKALPSHLETPYIYIRGHNPDQRHKAEKKKRPSPPQPTPPREPKAVNSPGLRPGVSPTQSPSRSPAQSPSASPTNVNRTVTAQPGPMEKALNRPMLNLKNANAKNKPLSANEKTRQRDIEKKEPMWNPTTHTMYLQLQDNPRLYNFWDGDVQPKLTKEYRERLFENNVRTMDQTFKIFDAMQKKSFKGQMEADPIRAEQESIHLYKELLRSKLNEAQAKVALCEEQWAKTCRKRNELIELRNQEEKIKQEKAEELRKINEMLGVTSEIPTFDEDEIARRKKAKLDEEATKMAAMNVENLLEAQKKQAYEKEHRLLKEQEEYIFDQLNDPQMKADERTFHDFLHHAGLPDDQSTLVSSLFKAYSEIDKINHSKRAPVNFLEVMNTLATEVRNVTSVPKVNVRTFLFNYRRYLEDKYKRKDLVSSKKAKDLNSLLRHYITEWKDSFPKFPLPKMSKLAEQEKKNALLDLIPWEIVNQTTRKDLEIFHYLKLLEQFDYVGNKLKEFNNCPYNTARLYDKFRHLCGNLPVDLSSNLRKI